MNGMTTWQIMKGLTAIGATWPLAYLVWVMLVLQRG